VLRRLIALSIVWLGLVVGTPALACSLGAFGTDCCPPDGSPCKGSGTVNLTQLTAASCCATPAAPSQVAASIDAPRCTLDCKGDQSSPDPDPDLALGPASQLARTVHQSLIHSRGEISTRRDAALTYLDTGRLRL